MEIHQLIEKLQESFSPEEFDFFTRQLLEQPYDIVEKMLIAAARKENRGAAIQEPEEVQEEVQDDTEERLEMEKKEWEFVRLISANAEEIVGSPYLGGNSEERISSFLTEENLQCWQLPNFDPVFIRGVLLKLLKQNHGETIVRAVIRYLKENADQRTYEDVTDFRVLRDFVD